MESQGSFSFTGRFTTAMNAKSISPAHTSHIHVSKAASCFVSYYDQIDGAVSIHSLSDFNSCVLLVTSLCPLSHPSLIRALSEGNDITQRNFYALHNTCNLGLSR